ncbi:hypothetical protein DS893_10395 [Vibrionales bacterium C3R12]|nr:hypothetical protein DS893_10395 [Vibrionales bacterium C3R12]
MHSDEHIRLAAQSALLGNVTRGLRAVSVEIELNTIKWRCVFGSEVAKESQWEILSKAAGKVMANFPEEMQLDEEYIIARFRNSGDEPPNQIEHLKHIVFLRFEQESYPELAL